MPEELEILMSGDTSEVLLTFENLSSSELSTIDRVAEEALRGRPRQSRMYAQAYLSILNRMLEYFGPRINPIVARLALTEAPKALVSIWARRLGPSSGVVLALVEQFRRAVKTSFLQQVRLLDLAGTRNLQFPLEHVNEIEFDLFCRYVEKELFVARRATPLSAIAEIFDLNFTELGNLFDVSRQAAKKWLLSGDVPSERKAKVEVTLQIAELLVQNLKTERIPGIVRNDANWFNGKSILQAIAEDYHYEVLNRIRESFDWNATA